MSEQTLKQFVPSEICLKCKGCCRYKDAQSAWRPKLSTSDREGLADLIMAGDVIDGQSYINTIQVCGEHLCRFLKTEDNTCRIYARRPFECSLYPFILSQTHDLVKVYVHLSCPYIQDHLSRGDYEAYVVYLKEFFRQGTIREFILRNKDMLHDYSPYALELLHLFDLTFL